MREEFAGLVALCQMLPGPASSQVGFLIGLRRAGWSGALAAWAGFTLPSALVMFAFARLAPHLHGAATASVLHGLRLVAVAVVAQAVWSMARTLCPDRRRTALALLAAVLLLVAGGPVAQIAALLLGAVGGALLCRDIAAAPTPPAMPVARRAGGIALAVFGVLLVGLPVVAAAAPHGLLAFAAISIAPARWCSAAAMSCCRCCATRWCRAGGSADDRFLAGYGFAQAIPGPLFTFSAYLGGAVAPAGMAGAWAAVALAFMFLPGLLLAVAGVTLWAWLGRHPAARAALAGVNAAVVGVLGAALYDPIWVSAVHSGRDLAIAATGWLLLARWQAPPVVVVAFCVLASVAAGVWG